MGWLVRLAAWTGREAKADLKLGICGEHGGDPDSIDFFERSGLDYVSCSPYRVPGGAGGGGAGGGAQPRRVSAAGAIRGRCDNRVVNPPAGTTAAASAFEARIREREDGQLAAHATRSYPARRAREEPDSPLRTPFQRDRDRVLHSKAFRRLKHKTQVFVAPEGDHYRTRLTHTLEVTQVSRTVARALSLNEDLVEAIGLGHDLGHPPFGHIGEAVLDRCLRERFGGEFRHYEHSLRVVDVLERDGAGLNLTEPVRDGILRHSSRAAMPATAEGRIVRLVDRIAYINHDIDDAVRAGVIAPDDLPAAEIATLGPDGVAAHRRAGGRPGRALRARRGHRAGRAGGRGDVAPARVHVRARVPGRGGAQRAPAHRDRAAGAVRPLLRAPRADRRRTRRPERRSSA